MGNSLAFVPHEVEAYVVAIREMFARGRRSLMVRGGHLAESVIRRVRQELKESEFQYLRHAADPTEGLIADLPVEDHARKADCVLLVEDGAPALSALLMDTLDFAGDVVAPITEHYFRQRPLFLTSMPKAGAHLMMALLEKMGYVFGGEHDDRNFSGGRFYFVDPQNPHCDFRDAYLHLTRLPLSGRLHPLWRSPIILLYRHPLAQLVSQAHYTRLPENTFWAYYYSRCDKDEQHREMLLDDDAYPGVAKRMILFGYWLRLVNVINVSYEEIVGSQGGGSDEQQLRTIWSLQLKLHIPGRPSDFAAKIYDRSSRTFRSGQINSFTDEFSPQFLAEVRKMPTDWLDAYGYDLLLERGVLPRRIDEFLRRPLEIPPPIEDWRFVPKFVEEYAGYNILALGLTYYGVPHDAGEVEMRDVVAGLGDRCARASTLQECREIIDQRQCSVSTPRPIGDYLGFNLIHFGRTIHGVAQALGNLDVAKLPVSQVECYRRVGQWFSAATEKEVKAMIDQGMRPGKLYSAGDVGDAPGRVEAET